MCDCKLQMCQAKALVYGSGCEKSLDTAKHLWLAELITALKFPSAISLGTITTSSHQRPLVHWRRYCPNSEFTFVPRCTTHAKQTLGKTNINSCPVTQPVSRPSHRPLTCPSINPPVPPPPPLFILTRFQIESPRTHKCISPSAKSDNPSIIGHFVDPSWAPLICLLGTRNKQRAVVAPSSKKKDLCFCRPNRD